MMRAILLVLAALATLYASAAFVCRFDADFEVSAVLAALCLGGVFWLDHLKAERRRYRAEVWERRDREAGQR
jgi:hypothetical protein